MVSSVALVLLVTSSFSVLSPADSFVVKNQVVQHSSASEDSRSDSLFASVFQCDANIVLSPFRFTTLERLESYRQSFILPLSWWKSNQSISVPATDGSNHIVVKGSASRRFRQEVLPNRALSEVEAAKPRTSYHPPAGRNLQYVPTSEWVLFVLFVGMLLLIDYFFVQQIHGDSTPLHLLKFLAWTSVGIFYCYRVRSVLGGTGAVLWSSGYMLEALFAIDNLFIFHFIFRYYNTPRRLQEKALFACLLGQIVTRTVFFSGMALIVRRFVFVTYAVGAFLIFLGIQMLAARGAEHQILQQHAPSPSMSEMRLIRWTKSLVGTDRVINTYDEEGDRFFLSGSGFGSASSDDSKNKLRATLLVIVVMSMLLTDCFFAIDVVVAKIEEIGHFYINLTSGILSLFAIKSLYFLIAAMVDHIALLNYMLGCVLMFIGGQLLVSETHQLSAYASCGVILGIMAAFLIMSGLQGICLSLSEGDSSTSRPYSSREPIAGARS